MIKKLKKAIRHFECMRDDNIAVLNSGFGTKKGEHNSLYKNRKMYAELAIEALEKQIFKFVECKGWNGHSGTRYKCPTCKKIIRCGYEYCSNCGQAVKFPKLKTIDNKIVLDWSEADDSNNI